MTRTRMDIWKRSHAEGNWPAVLKAYDKAVGLMRKLDPVDGSKPKNELGWEFWAAMHGRATATGAQDTSNKLWTKCQHGSWFFLPWHRMYILAFEAVIQDTIGDPNWSLPYWYSLDPDDASTSVVPPAFRDTKKGNNLFTPHRSLLANGGDPLPNIAQSVTDAIEADVFSTEDGTSTFGGGERSKPSFNGQEVGLLEDTPHGAVHVLVGNDYDNNQQLIRAGWMGSFFTAALDPIFWLHHANIDRLWQVWLDADPAHKNPPDNDPAWFKTSFSFPKAGGGRISWKVGDVLDMAALGYRYESTAAPSTVTPSVVAPQGQLGGPNIGLGGAEEPAEPMPPQVVGATQDVPLTTGAAVDVNLVEPVDLGLAAGVNLASAGRVYLRLEGITGTAAAPVYEVYLNLPANEPGFEHPELCAGRFSTFGVAEASRADALHDGTGVTKVFEITRVRNRLADQGRWDAANVQVSFVPIIPSPSDTNRFAEIAEAAEPRAADLSAARIAVVFR